MKNYRLLTAILILLFAFACSDDDQRDTDFVEEISAPTNVDLVFTMSQDNSGLVTITPSAGGASKFEVFYGDGTNGSDILNPGESTSNIYPEGDYTVNVIATSINGLTTEYTENLMVDFRAPENLVVNIEAVAGDVFSINISASAEFETFFEFYPGVDENEDAIQFMEGETITYTFNDTGDYDVRVVAVSGGSAITEYTETITIANPLLLPVTFEDATLDYEFIDFGGAVTSVVSNPDMTSTNNSANVAQTIKIAGAETFAGTILQIDETLDFSSGQNVRVDVWSPKSGITVKMKLENNDDPNISTEIDVVNSTENAWETLFFDFSEEDLSQDYGKVILFFDFGNAGDDSTYFFDNIDITSSSGGVSPDAAAPTPTATNVISLFSDAYDDVNVDTWNTIWSNSGFEDIEVEGNPVKYYFNLGFNGIETTSQPVNAEAASMTHIHLDVWTPNITTLRLKLVDFKGDGFQGGNGDTEAELSFTPAQGEWVGLDIPLADFAAAGMTDFSDINQYIISSDPFEEGILYVDNVYFYSDSTEPNNAAPTPTLPGANVISLFSDAYDDVNVDTWNTVWSNSGFEDITIDEDPTKYYFDLGFNGIETTTTSVDASGMTHFHMDIWTPNITAFRIKLVDFKGDGFQGATGDTEAELSFTPSQGGWVSLDIPLSEFEAAGMTDFSDINQYIISSDPFEEGIVYVDNVYFHN